MKTVRSGVGEESMRRIAVILFGVLLAVLVCGCSGAPGFSLL
jgi:hypothetical protein